MYDKNAFVTLTYHPDHLPENGTLVKKHVQDFLKRLRKNTGWTFKYFAAGEYGTDKGRLHYHIILFGVEFPDMTYWRKSPKGMKIYRSKILEKAWKLGHSEIGTVTPQSASYTANYVTKKNSRR